MLLDEKIKLILEFDYTKPNNKQQLEYVYRILQNFLKEIHEQCLVPHEKPLKDFFQQWISICHPSVKKIKKDFIYEGKLIITAKSMKAVNELSPLESTFQNKGIFFSLLNKAYQAFFPHDDPLLSPGSSLPSFEIWLDNLIFDNPHFYMFSSKTATISLNLTNVIHQKVSSNQYFVGYLKEWLEYILQSKIYELLKNRTDKDSFYHELKNSIRFPEIAALLPNEASKLITPSPSLFTAQEASIKYHLMRAKEIATHPLVISVSIFSNRTLKSYTPTKEREMDIYRSHLQLVFWQILYADPTKCKNFNKHEYMDISYFSKREITDKQYETLYSLFLDDKHLLNQLKLEPDLINLLKSKANPKENWNWLIKGLDWIYAEGPDASFDYPWILRERHRNKGGGTFLGSPTYYANRLKFLDKLCDYWTHTLLSLSLTQLLKKHIKNFYARNLIWIFFCFLTINLLSPLIFSGTIGFHLFNTCIIPLFSLMIAVNFDFWSTIAEKILHRISEYNQNFKLYVPPWCPDYLKFYYARIITPLWRIISQPLEENISQKEKMILFSLYAIRIILGILFAATSTAALILASLSIFCIKLFLISVIHLTNLPFALSSSATSFFEKSNVDIKSLSNVKEVDVEAASLQTLLFHFKTHVKMQIDIQSQTEMLAPPVSKPTLNT